MNKFERALEKLNIHLNEKQMYQFQTYYEMLVETNKVMNLTAITEMEDVITKHFIDSLCLIKAVPQLGKQKILDLGTGAGFPGIPLKIVFPDLEIVLMDSLNKRIHFLEEVIQRLDLKNISAVHGRAEEMARKGEYRQQFDICVSRAVANLASLAEYCIPFVKIGGCFVSYKSADVDEEAENAKRAVFLMGGKIEDVIKFRLPGSDQGRSLIYIKKEKGTPKAYPRKAGTPARNPILP